MKSQITAEMMNEEARVRLVDALKTRGAHLTYESAVDGFPEELINRKPPHVPYSFWHQLEHIRRTQADMINYIKDPGYVSPEWPREYWPPQEATTDRAGWDTTIREYLSDRNEFIELVSDPGINLLAPVEHMSNRSVLRAVLVIIDHTSYHLGEFVLGRQMLGAWESELA